VCRDCRLPYLVARRERQEIRSIRRYEGSQLERYEEPILYSVVFLFPSCIRLGLDQVAHDNLLQKIRCRPCILGSFPRRNYVVVIK